jgi:putative transposase
MPRIPRGLVDGFIYHVINRGNGRQKVFHKEQDYEAFNNLMEEAKGRHPVKILAYCLIPNHFHMVLKPEKAEELSKFMGILSGSKRYAKHMD